MSKACSVLYLSILQSNGQIFFPSSYLLDLCVNISSYNFMFILCDSNQWLKYIWLFSLSLTLLTAASQIRKYSWVQQYFSHFYSISIVTCVYIKGHLTHVFKITETLSLKYFVIFFWPKQVNLRIYMDSMSRLYTYKTFKGFITHTDMNITMYHTLQDTLLYY